VEDDLDLRLGLEHVEDEGRQGEELPDPFDRLDGEARHIDLRELETVFETHSSSPSPTVAEQGDPASAWCQARETDGRCG
jgi:hypothetical protein